jgi:hypothetical protein
MATAGTIEVEVTPYLGELSPISTWRANLPNWITAFAALGILAHQIFS